MKDFPVRTPQQLPSLLQSFRKARGLTQADVAQRLGVTQQTLSALERNAESVSVERLMRLLAILEVDLTLSTRTVVEAVAKRSGRADW